MKTNKDNKIDFSEAAHVLRAPLTILRTQAALSESQDLSQENFNELVATVKQQTAYMANVLSNLSTLYRIDSSNESKTEVNVKDIIDELISNIVSTAVENNCEIKIEDIADESVNIEKLGLLNVLQALITNAIIHGGQNKEVKISYAKKQFLIEDQGEGFPENIEDLAKPFSTQANLDYKTAGLGLSVAKRLSDKYNWQLDLSNSNNGAVVSLNIS